MQFHISIKYDHKPIRLLVEHAFIDHRIEQFKVIARNGTLTFESNRPFFRHKGLKHRKPDYKLIEGSLWNMTLQKEIIEAIHDFVVKNME